MNDDIVVVRLFLFFSQGHHGRTRAISRLPVSPSAGHGHTSSHHGSHTHLNGHAPKSEHESSSSSKRRPAAIGGGDSKSKGPDAHRVNGQVKRSSLVMDAVTTRFGRQASKDESSRSSTTSSSDQASLMSSQKQTTKFFPKLL